MKRDLIHPAVRALLPGLMLAACGAPEAEVTPSEEPLGRHEAAVCAGASVTSLTLSNVSSYGGEVVGMGNWQVIYPANAVYLEYFIDGVRYGYGERSPEDPVNNRAGSWHFSQQNVSCGVWHTLEVKAWPVVIGSTNHDVCGSGPSRTVSQMFYEECPTSTLSCARSSMTTISCTGSGAGGNGGPHTGLWYEIERNFSTGVESQFGWYQGSMTNSFYCPMNFFFSSYNGDLSISFKAQDASGLQSAALSQTFRCKF